MRQIEKQQHFIEQYLTDIHKFPPPNMLTIISTFQQ